MQYDPIKKSLGNIFNRTPWLRILFYHLLDLLLLRTWHVKKALRSWRKTEACLGPARIPNPGSRIPDPGSRILDAGSGFGQYSYFLSGMSHNLMVDAVDVKEEQIADCNSFFQTIGRTNVQFAVADLTTFSKPDNYDLILSVDVMEHILEDETVFRNFHQSLKSGGMVLISTPSDQGGSDVHDHDEEESFIDEHVRDGYNIQEIQEKLKRAGFGKTKAHFTYGTPGQIGWHLSMKYPIKMLNTSKLFFILLPFYYVIIFPVALLLNFLDVKVKHKRGTGLIVKAWK
jgi:2-polyprenyl-3-methyl-5-hydroxy-6-metoxy-1,4-benzoquinol methylase